ncbi:hypothetical protein [Aquabacterium sp.]|uniref:hypothetical protein n=1 Tax=Aquabacterium sp. TaxID=1872578 RepID=UPI003B73D878
MKCKFWLAALVAVSSLVGCGGGGSDAGTSPFGSNTSTSSTATALIMSLSKTTVSNTDATPVTVTVTAVNDSGEVVAKAPIAFEVSGGQLYRTSTVTGTDGKLTATVDFSADKSNRVVTVKATSGNVSETRSFSVTGIKIATTPLPSVLSPGDVGKVDIAVTDASGSAISGLAVSASSSLGSISNLAETGSATGVYRYSFTLPSTYTSTEFQVAVSAGGVSQTVTIPVTQSTSVVVPDAAVIGSVDLAVEPTVIAANTSGSTANQATVRFKAFDVSGNPLANVRVSFDENAVLPGKGTFASAASVLYTDADGVATTAYIPGTATTGPNGLVLRACYSRTDFVPSSSGTASAGSAACPVATTNSATIIKDAFNITIGPNDKIEETSDGLRYVVKYVVQVVNASGQAKANVQITPTLDLTGFEKGSYGYDGSAWVRNNTLPSTATYADRDNSDQTYYGCANEDEDRNGVNAGTSEDHDNDKVLEPRKSDAAISFIDATQTKTDATGAVGLQVTYLKNVASWLRIKIYVTGVVSGTEGTGTFTEVLPYPSGILGSEAKPAFADNPYGKGTSCSVH